MCRTGRLSARVEGITSFLVCVRVGFLHDVFFLDWHCGRRLERCDGGEMNSHLSVP